MIKKKAPHFSDDVYALACVFYITLTGKHPFDKLPADQAQQNKMVPPSINILSKHQWKVLRKALAFESKYRYQSVDEFNHDFHKQTKYTLSKKIILMRQYLCLVIVWGLSSAYNLS